MLKAVIIETSPEIATYLRVGRILLPPGVAFAGSQESFERFTELVRLEGDGLPDSAKVVEAERFKRATFTENGENQPVTINILE